MEIIPFRLTANFQPGLSLSVFLERFSVCSPETSCIIRVFQFGVPEPLGTYVGGSAVNHHQTFCEGEVIVQGDEGPVRGVAQVVDCHGVTVGHEEREEEVDERQEVESDEEKTLKERCACPWMG